MSDELPQGWEMPLLGEVVRIKQGNSKITKKLFKPDGKYVAFSGSGPDGLVENYEHEGKAIILSSVGARCGKCFKANGQWTAIANTAVVRPLPTDDGHFDYLFYLLNNENFWPKGGSAQPFVQTGLAQRETRIPLPPLNEQRRIVAKLTELLGKVDASQQRLAKIPVLLKRFRQSVLAAACSGRLTADWREERTTDCTDDTDKKPSVKSAKSVVKNSVPDDAGSTEDLPDGWRNAPLSEFLECSFYGPRFGKESYASQGVPTIRTTDMGFDGSIVLTDAPRIKLSREELEKYCLRHGDLVVTRTGATIGKCAVYDEARGPAIPGAYLIRFRFKLDLVDPKYVLRFFMSPAGQNLLIGGSNAVAQPNVNATTISQFVISVPPLPEQQEIVRRVGGLFALADQLEERLAKARGQVDALTPSLLARAFAGQLVPQDPTDEPAEKLLERIRNEGPRIEKGEENS